MAKITALTRLLLFYKGGAKKRPFLCKKKATTFGVKSDEIPFVARIIAKIKENGRACYECAKGA